MSSCCDSWQDDFILGVTIKRVSQNRGIKFYSFLKEKGCPFETAPLQANK